MENSEPLLLIGSPIDVGGGVKEQARRAVRNTVAPRTVLASHTFKFRRQFEPGTSSGLHEQVPKHVPDSDRQLLVWPKEPKESGA